ncbi:MAG TPA: DUF3047 domain-containing protein [Alphaproteobacteria bacterium]
MRRRRLALALAATLAAVPVSRADEVLPIGPDLEALGWQVLTFSGKAADRFVGHDDGSLEVISERSVSMLHRPVAVDLAAAPCLSWRWRVDEAPPPTNLTAHGGDDRALAVFVAFPFDGEHASFWEQLVRPLVELFYGADAPGRVVAYVWGGRGQPGDMQSSAYMGAAGRNVLLHPGDAPLGQWLEETVDVAADYRRAFDDPVTRPVRLAITSDTDDTRSRAHAWIAALRFHAGCGQPAGAR